MESTVTNWMCKLILLIILLDGIKRHVGAELGESKTATAYKKPVGKESSTRQTMVKLLIDCPTLLP
jgi:hypothetical protein